MKVDRCDGVLVLRCDGVMLCVSVSDVCWIGVDG